MVTKRNHHRVDTVIVFKLLYGTFLHDTKELNTNSHSFTYMTFLTNCWLKSTMVYVVPMQHLNFRSSYLVNVYEIIFRAGLWTQCFTTNTRLLFMIRMLLRSDLVDKFMSKTR